MGYSAAEVERLPVGSLITIHGDFLLVVPGGLIPLFLVPERRGHVPEGEPARQWGDDFALVSEGHGHVATRETVLKKSIAYIRSPALPPTSFAPKKKARPRSTHRTTGRHRSAPTTAAVAILTAGQINRELDRLEEQRSALTDRFIAEGRGSETAFETWKLSDPLARSWQAVSGRAMDLRNEIELRYGPGAPRRLPTRGFGPRET